MRTRILFLAVALGTVAGGCATMNRPGGAGGAEVVAGEAKTEASETGATTNQVATNGSDTTDTTGKAVPR
ncbi:MAG: hypothetical protein JWM53_5199 [bacterium]|nr:hypothetical protein [bacterium]